MKNMRKNIRRVLLIALACISLEKGTAQTVVWQMLPISDYDKILRVAPNLYKAEKNGKLGLIKPDGTVLVDLADNTLSSFYEHKALLTCMDERGERILGVVSDDGRFHKFTNKYYTLKGQKFFSDEWLSVSDEDGNAGYVDCMGNAQLGFDRKYDRIKPFVEGFAAVFKNKRYHLIDKDGNEVRFRFPGGIGTVAGGTNVFNGFVYIIEGDGDFYTYDINQGMNGMCVKTKKPKSLSFDYLYRYSSVSGKDKNVPFSEIQESSDVGISLKEHEGLYGYLMNDNIVLPYQFSYATFFEDGFAVVGLADKIGILKFVKNGTFGLSQQTSSHKFFRGDEVKCEFKISYPDVWKEQDVDVIVTDSLNNGYTLVGNADGMYSFSVRPESTTAGMYTVKVTSRGLVLYKDKISYSFVKKIRCPICGKDKEICKGFHPESEEVLCPDCGKKISECKYAGVHDHD